MKEYAWGKWMEGWIKGQTGRIDGHSVMFGQTDKKKGGFGWTSRQTEHHAILTLLERSFLSMSRHPGNEAGRGLVVA